MEALFEQICNLSISASWLILAVFVARYFLRKAPKKYICMLWMLVGLRLVLPFSIESSLSLVPSVNITTLSGIMSAAAGDVEKPVQAVENAENMGVQVYRPISEIMQSEAANRNDTDEISSDISLGIKESRTILRRLSYVWLIGMAGMLLYFAGTYLYLKHKLSTAVIFGENIWQSEYVFSPFILGLVRPRIYIPYQIEKSSLGYVLAHENVHIKRKDHWTKVFAFLILSVYWFHPLVWVSYALLCKDIEMACDEQVIAVMDEERKKAYSLALLSCTGKRSWYSACPVGFGEVKIKERVKRVMHYQKPSFWIILLSIVVGIVCVVCFFTSTKPEDKQNADLMVKNDALPLEAPEESFGENTLSVEDILINHHDIWKDYAFQWLSWNELSQLTSVDYTEWISEEGANGRMVYRTAEGVTYLLPEYANGVNQIAGILVTDEKYQLGCGLSVGMSADSVEELEIPLDIYVKDEQYGRLRSAEGIGEISLYDGLNNGQMLEFDYAYSNSDGFVMNEEEQREKLQTLGVPEERLSEVHFILSAFVKNEKVVGIFMGIVP